MTGGSWKKSERNWHALKILFNHRKNRFSFFTYTQRRFTTLMNLTAYITIAFNNASVYKNIESQSEILRKQSDKLEELDKLNTRFFINISHEFRTPLTLIITPLENMLQQKTAGDWSKFYKQLVIMNNNAKQLLRLINELLKVRNTEAGSDIKLSAVETDIVSFATDIVGRFTEIGQQYNLRFFLSSFIL